MPFLNLIKNNMKSSLYLNQLLTQPSSNLLKVVLATTFSVILKFLGDLFYKLRHKISTL
jgi:hypothetical protein